MSTTRFHDGWTFRRTPESETTPVALPHDAMIGEPRSAEAGTGNHGGYFPGGKYRYENEWTVPADAAAAEYRLFFEGVYGDTTVWIDDVVVARNVSGYREFRAPLGVFEPGSTHRIVVDVDNSRTPNSRWYTGAGLYRPVWLEQVGTTRIAVDGIRLATTAMTPQAALTATVRVDGAAFGDVVEIALAGGAATSVTGTATIADGVAQLELLVPDARLWSAETPHLYDVTVTVRRGTVPLDEHRLRYGIRTLSVDARHGVRINGVPVLLRGACIHHDNGILGAATFDAAEYRRARLLKEAGYNAIRSSHNPLSRAFLDACDELGLYVMDELTDVWLQHKTAHDLADRFDDVWPDDARAMVAKDRNRPSVIMYSIGNEIAETATAEGQDAARRVSAFLRDLDPSRPTTLAVNLLLNVMASKGKNAHDREQPKSDGDRKKATSTAANMLTAKLGRVMELVSRLPMADKASKDAFAAVDVAGYNYAFGRYASDRKRYPNRVIVGSESMPGDLPAIWRRVEAVPGVIGDFMWTGWDYLGEAGIGVWTYGDEPGGLNKPYPALIAGPGAFDILGRPGAPLFLAQAVWGLLDAPAIAVRPMNRIGRRANRTPWRTSDAVPSWSWRGAAGRAEIEVYSDADQVELLLNGRSLGRKRAGRRTGYIARFRTLYEPGELTAISYRDDVETGRATLRTAATVALTLRAETPRSADDDIVFVWAELADHDGTVDFAASDEITLTIDGPGALVGFGSAAPATEETFTSPTHTTHHGTALAGIRRTAAEGDIVITARSRRHGDASIALAPALLATAR
jgi:beta-galactosidase